MQRLRADTAIPCTTTLQYHAMPCKPNPCDTLLNDLAIPGKNGKTLQAALQCPAMTLQPHQPSGRRSFLEVSIPWAPSWGPLKVSRMPPGGSKRGPRRLQEGPKRGLRAQEGPRRGPKQAPDSRVILSSVFLGLPESALGPSWAPVEALLRFSRTLLGPFEGAKRAPKCTN